MRQPLHPNPDVAEVLANNRDACKHEHMYTVTRWKGGSPGRMGGQTPVDYWYCPECKQDVRPWMSHVDDPKTKAFLDDLAKNGLQDA